MSIEAAAEQNKESQPAISLPFPETRWGRVIYGLYVTVVPALAFWATAAFWPDWQSGRLSDYIVLFLSPDASLIFILLLIYAVLCYLQLLIAPGRSAQWFFIRLGVYTGTLLALQYSIVSAPFFFQQLPESIFILAWIFPLVFGPAYRWTTQKLDAQFINAMIGILLVGAFVAGSLLGSPGAVLIFFIMVITMAAPFWCFLIGLRATLWLLKNHETKLSLPRGVGLVTWLAAYAVAWRLDILRMYELYAALPKEPPPDCYIATAATYGHPQFVKARTVRCAGGRFMQVNVQLQRLKCAELALLAVSPHLHRPLRQAYDVIGKYLAARIRNPFRADAAYLLLKPCEWLVRLVLRLVVPEIDTISEKIYRDY